MLIVTTNDLQDKKLKYLGIVTGEVILGANFFKDFMAGITNVLGGRSGQYESSLEEARKSAMREMEQRAAKMGANAIIAVDIDYETITTDGSSMLMVACSGTAVVVEN